MKRITLLLTAVALALMANLSFAKDDDADKAIAMVKKAIQVYKTGGLEKVINAVNDPKGEFNDGAYYVRIYDMEATVLAHPVNPKLLGTSILNYKDADGKEFMKEIMTMAKTQPSGWSDYKYRNPKTNEIEPKSTYFERVDDLVFCNGIYKK